MHFIKKIFGSTQNAQGGGTKPNRTSVSSNRTSGSSSLSMRKRSSSGTKMRRSRQGSATAQGSIFCSDMYSVDHILQEMTAIGENENVTRLVFEDLIERNDPEVLAKAKEFLVDTSCSMDKGTALRGGRLRSSANKSGDKATSSSSVKRVWDSITFVGCISDAEDYRQYLERKHQFQNELNRLLAMKRVEVPIRFKTKLEIHSMLTLASIIELLREVDRDEDILTVEFAQFSGKSSRIAKEMAKQVDAATLEWTGPPVEILLRYDGEDINTKEDATTERFTESPLAHRPTAVLLSCAKALAKLQVSARKDRTKKLMVDQSLTENTEASSDGLDLAVPQVQKIEA